MPPKSKGKSSFVADPEYAYAHDVPFGPIADMALTQMEGFKKRLKSGKLMFWPSMHNLAIMNNSLPNSRIDLPQKRATEETKDVRLGKYLSRPDPPAMTHQKDGFIDAVKHEHHALFMEQGTGKSRTAIDIAGWRFARGEITGVLIVTFKGLHEQWTAQQIPTHLGNIQIGDNIRAIPYATAAWVGKPVEWAAKHAGRLEFFATTFSAVTARSGDNLGEITAHDFADRHRGKLLMIVDESQAIKQYDTERTESCIRLGDKARFKLVLSGTPIAKSIEDEWSQLSFLSKDIFGYQYVSTFRAEYADKWGNPRNIEQFKKIAAPYIFRITKDECLDLPPKIYDEFTFDIDAKSRKAYFDLKRNFLAEVETAGGIETFTVQNAAVLLLRLQQIANGLIVNEDGTEHILNRCRADALASLLPRFDEQKKIILWHRFRTDVTAITNVLTTRKEQFVLLNGGVPPEERPGVADTFMNNPDCKYLISNTAVGGTGFNFQGECRTSIYYTNSFNSLHRWQSEDRVHRIGTIWPCHYIDLRARNVQIDTAILKNIREKKDLADLLLAVTKELEAEVE